MFQSPQWGSNSKWLDAGYRECEGCFSPRNGEVILNGVPFFKVCILEFQSPQWGSNSKAQWSEEQKAAAAFQSPQWGSNSKISMIMLKCLNYVFQSPQWGSNSKQRNTASIW